MKKLPNAEDVNYWKTGQTAADTWIEKTAREIRAAGGKWVGDYFGNDVTTGRAAYMVNFRFGDDEFKVIWPVLPNRSSSERAARIQAATFLYHDVKATCMKAKIFGARAAFFSHLLLPDGRVAAEVATPELVQGLPALFASPRPQLTTGGEIVEGEWSDTGRRS